MTHPDGEKRSELFRSPFAPSAVELNAALCDADPAPIEPPVLRPTKNPVQLGATTGAAGGAFVGISAADTICPKPSVIAVLAKNAATDRFMDRPPEAGSLAPRGPQMHSNGRSQNLTSVDRCGFATPKYLWVAC